MNSIEKAFLFFALIGLTSAQAPTGTIAGVARDPSAAAVAGAHVKLTSQAVGFGRTAVTSEQGDYAFPALPAGEYEVSVEASGFQRMVRPAVVEAGTTTTSDFNLRVGEVTESVSVDSASPQMHYDSASVGGLTPRGQIEDLPLNGRSFLELAKLEPGVQPPSTTNNNRTFAPVLGAPLNGGNGSGTRVTVDGGSIMAVGAAGSQMGFSQEVVQEFQISTVNFDLSTGITATGAVNVVTRSGGNGLHGTALYFFRDHKLAAYPALNRDPANPDPFFQRRQFGFALGGPIRRDRIFFLGNWERNEQRGVMETTLAADFAHFSRITPTPFFGDQLSVRVDGRISNAHTAFVRYSHDGSRTFLATIGNGPNAYPSNWSRTLFWGDQSLLGLTSVLRPTLVNDLRFSYFFTSFSQTAPREQDCPGCLGLGAPGIKIPQAGLFIGHDFATYSLARRFHFSDTVTWQRSTHRARFGVDWEHNRGGNLMWQNEPATITLFPPYQARQANIPIPPAFGSLDDILQLPLQSVTVAVGDPRVPQENGGMVRRWNTVRVFFQDTWRLRQRLTLNYGLGWNIDRDLNYDLRKPALLEPLLGAGGLGPTRKQWKNVSPVLGLAWTPWPDGKTVVRAGAGIFYGFLFAIPLDPERAALGPPGLGRQTFPGTSILNTLTGILGVPVGTPLNFLSNPTMFTGADLMAILPAIRADKLKMLANADPTLQAIQVNKQAPGVFPADVPTLSALHTSLGVQREIARDFVLSADFAYRHFTHVDLGAIDLNHFNSVHGPVIHVCTAAQRNDPLALCSRGAINVRENVGRSAYKGLLLRAEKRFSRGFQILGSYAYFERRWNQFWQRVQSGQLASKQRPAQQ